MFNLSGETPVEYTTEKGLALILKEVSPALVERVVARAEEDLRAEGGIIARPTYTLKNAAGETQIFELTEKVLAPSDENEAAYRQATWDAYQSSQQKIAEVQSEARVKFLLTWAIDFEMPADNAWHRMLKAAGVEVPEDEDERRFAFLWYVALTPLEIQTIVAELSILAYGKAVNEEDVRSFRDGLQDSVRQRAKNAIAGSVRAVQEIGGAEA